MTTNSTEDVVHISAHCICVCLSFTDLVNFVEESSQLKTVHKFRHFELLLAITLIATTVSVQIALFKCLQLVSRILVARHVSNLILIFAKHHFGG